MHFGFTAEQRQLREQLRRFLTDQAPMSAVRAAAASPLGFSREAWRSAGELGWLGLLTPAEYDGAGLGWVDALVLLEETGRALLPSPFVSHCLAQALLAQCGSDEQRRAHLPALASGTRIAVPALFDEPDLYGRDGVTLAARIADGGYLLDGDKPFVADAGAADLFLVAFRPGPAGDVRVALVELDALGLSVTSGPTLDATKRVGTLHFDGLRIAPDALLPGADGAALATHADRGAMAVTAEGVGAMERLLELTAEYAKQRIQFGQPIGRYQGVKHRLAEIYVDVESVKSLVYYAAWCADHDPAGLPRAASLAKAYAADSFPRIGIDGVQLHGAIGYTDDYDAQLYLKRAKWLRPAFGDADYHFDRVSALSARAA